MAPLLVEVPINTFGLAWAVFALGQKYYVWYFAERQFVSQKTMYMSGAVVLSLCPLAATILFLQETALLLDVFFAMPSLLCAMKCLERGIRLPRQRIVYRQKCARCGYSLIGLKATQCPECGAAEDDS